MNVDNLKQKAKLGLSPGTPVFTGVQKMPAADITLITYSEKEVLISKPASVPEAIHAIETQNGVSWINIDGLHDLAIIEEICSFLGVHKLTVEDILSVNQRPKLEEHEAYIHLAVKMLTLEGPQNLVSYEQVSFLLKGSVLATFQEKSGDAFEFVRRRISEDIGLIRKKDADYLLYALLDSIVDHYFVVLENIGEELTGIETELLDNPDKNTLNKIHLSRKEMISVRRSIYPMRDVVGRLDKLEEPVLSGSLSIYIRDLYDHTLRVMETIEGFRDTVSGLLDLYMNSMSNRMNEIMKVLTIMSAIFIPLTFIAGIYGMNFDYMPELRWRSAYHITLGVMLLIFVAMLIIFRKKKWL
jgi:magnesium transporter